MRGVHLLHTRVCERGPYYTRVCESCPYYTRVMRGVTVIHHPGYERCDSYTPPGYVGEGPVAQSGPLPLGEGPVAHSGPLSSCPVSLLGNLSYVSCFHLSVNNVGNQAGIAQGAALLPITRFTVGFPSRVLFPSVLVNNCRFEQETHRQGAL